MKKFPLETIQDCSNAINIGNKRKKMKKGHSLTSTYFQIIIRFFENNEDKFEEASLVLMDMAHQQNKEFTDLTKLNLDDNSFMNLPRDVYWQHLCLSRITKSINLMSFVKYRHGRPKTDYCGLTVLLRNYLFSNFKIVLITNINPAVENAEENLKVFHFSSTFKSGIKTIDRVLPASEKEFSSKFSLTKEREREKAWEKDKKKKEDNQKKEIDKSKENLIIISKEDKLKSKNSEEISDSPVKKVEENIISKSPLKKDDHSSKISSLNEKEKSNLFETLQKNQPKIEYKTIPLKSSKFDNWEPSDLKQNSKLNFIKDKEELPGKISNAEIENMKRDYENLKNKFEEQEKLIKTILDKSTSSKSEMNNGKLIPNREENLEVFSDVQKVFSDPIYKESVKILESNAQER